MTVDRSRGLRLAGLVTGRPTSELASHLDSATVAVSVDDEMPQARLTARALSTTLRRGLGELVLIADGLPDPFVVDLQERVAAIDPDRELKVVRGTLRLPDRAVRVHVGPVSPAASLRVVPEGFGAHVAGAQSAVIRPRRPGNPIGAVFSASLAAAEVFKHIARVRFQRRLFHRHLRFCPAALTDDLVGAPDLPSCLTLDFMLVGLGAIGTGIVLLLEELGVEGCIVLIDPEHFAPENVGTYSIGGAADGEVRPWKVDLAARHLPRFDITGKTVAVDEVVRAVDAHSVPWSPAVLTALDSPSARRDAQRLWPDRLIDAQTGDTMLGFCDHRFGIDPCMMCVFPVDRTQPSGAELVARRLGLSPERFAEPNAVLSDNDLRELTEEQRARLRPLVGTPMCGLAQAAGLSDLESGDFMPSVPFVSLQAACLSVCRLLRAKQGLDVSENLVQYDALYGPQASTRELMKPQIGCICSERRTSIEKVRSARRKVGRAF